MPDHPMLFRCALVRAHAEGRKTQTRRVLSPHNMRLFEPGRGMYRPDMALLQRAFLEASPPRHIENGTFVWKAKAFEYQLGERTHWQGRTIWAPGDRIYVRETWAQAWECDDDGEPATAEQIYYRSDGEPFDSYHMPDGSVRDGVPWRPAIHMPRWASRQTLLVTDVRLQRVQDISEEDARAEGAPDMLRDKHGNEWPDARYRIGFAHLWNSIRAKPKPVYRRDTLTGKRVIDHYESFPWGGEPRVETHRGQEHRIYPNPMVAAISYRVVLRNIDQLEEAA